MEDILNWGKYFKTFKNTIDNFLEIEKLEFTGPSPRNKNYHRVISYNIYPHENKLEKILNKINSLLIDYFKSWESFGEIIIYNNANGQIIDSGELSFLIEKAFHWECYFYEEESFIYCRLLQEFDLNDKRWISIDVDYVEKAAWF